MIVAWWATQEGVVQSERVKADFEVAERYWFCVDVVCSVDCLMKQAGDNATSRSCGC